MDKIEWKNSSYETVGGELIPQAQTLGAGYNQESGISRNSPMKLLLKRLLWPLVNLRNYLVIDGFIQREAGRLITGYLTAGSVFLEIGCGDMSLRKYLPENFWYNALDLNLSDFHILRALGSRERTNIVVASATEIPASSEVASLLVSTETFEHIPDIDRAVAELHRVAKPGAVLICSIPNNYCRKYEVKGPHPGHIQAWSYDEFKAYMEKRNFEFIEGFMKGKWLPFPLWLTKSSYQLPLSSVSEKDNTNFFYVFRVRKTGTIDR